jgi:hypothetical protein
VDDERRCIQCGRSLENRRPGAIFCRQKCKRKHYRQAARSNYEPPLPGTSSVRADTRADQRWRAAHADAEIRAKPLSDYEKALLQRQKRNPGPLLPELQSIMLDREMERRRALAAEAGNPIRVEDPLDPGSIGSVQRRAQQSRRANKHYQDDPNMHVLRPPGQPGPYPGDEPQVINGPSRNTPRWAM